MHLHLMVQVAPRTVLLEGGISPDTSINLPAMSVTIIATSPGLVTSS